MPGPRSSLTFSLCLVHMAQSKHHRWACGSLRPYEPGNSPRKKARTHVQIHATRGAIQDIEADAIVVGLFEGTKQPSGALKAVDDALDGAIAERIAAGDVRGALGEILVLYPRGAVPADRVLVVGLGPEGSCDTQAVRRASAAAAKRCRKLKATSMATVVHGAGAGGIDPERATQAVVEGALLGLYRTRVKESEADSELESILLVEADEAAIAAVERGAVVGEAVAAGSLLARDLVNGPPNLVTPTYLADVATDMAEHHGLRVHVGDRTWMAEQGMGALLAVAKGAEEPPRFITLEHGAERTDEAPIVLVGKGVTFDSGGLSLKTVAGMVSMKSDMGGAAAVLGAMKTVAMLGLPRRVVGIMACVENMPDGKAYRPSDVVRAGNGKTIEIISTDAEGRLALADALVHAAGLEPEWVVDVATLTGSCVRALGSGVAAGLFSNDDDVAQRLEKAGRETHERVWRLPLYADYREKIESDVADMKNSGGATGGVGTSAVFLQEFVDYRWAHLDIAGVVLASKASGYLSKGATGFGVRLLVEALRAG